MTKAPKHPSQRDDLKQRKDQGDTPRSKSTTRKPRISPKRTAETVLDAVSAEIPSDVMKGTEESTVSSLPPAQDDALARDGSLIIDGSRIGEDQQHPHSPTRDGATQPVQAVAFADVIAPRKPDQVAASDLPQPSEGVGMQADQKQESSQPHAVVHELKAESRENRKGSFRTDLEGRVLRAIKVWSPRLQAASDRVRGASGRVKVWAHDRATRRAHASAEVQGSANPVYILAAITLGIPALLLIPLVGMNPGVQEGTLTTVATFLVVCAFVTAAVFEIKRLADQPSDADHQ